MKKAITKQNKEQAAKDFLKSDEKPKGKPSRKTKRKFKKLTKKLAKEMSKQASPAPQEKMPTEKAITGKIPKSGTSGYRDMEEGAGTQDELNRMGKHRRQDIDRKDPWSQPSQTKLLQNEIKRNSGFADFKATDTMEKRYSGRKVPTPQHKTNSWEEEDVKRGREQEEKGHKGHAQALFDDAHDSYNWKGGNDGHESWFHKFKKKNPVTQLKAERKGRLVEDKINKPSTNDSLAVYMQNDYNKMYKEGEIDKPEGNWSDVAKKAEETYPGLSKAVGNTMPKGLVTGATMSNAREAREKYGLAKQKSAAPRFKDFDQMDTWDAKSVAKQTAFQEYMKKYPSASASDTLAVNDPRENFGFPTERSIDLNKAFDDTYSPDPFITMDIADEEITEEEGRAQGAANNAKIAKAKEAAAMKEKLYQDYINQSKVMTEKAAPPQNKTMAYKKSCAYRQDGHGQSKGDQSATHTDYANYKGTDKGYHGKTGASHGDQSATHRDYVHPIHKHMKR